jgi:AraC family transcriptional regulator, regulatory protein of adaptative response / methylated-DNA-[protein]-cysteine methyltransferase
LIVIINTSMMGFMEIKYGIHDSVFGEILVGQTTQGICYLSFDTSLRELKRYWPEANFQHDPESTHPDNASHSPLDLKGTPFQLKVWRALLTIPFGSTVSYQKVAQLMGRPTATRAVASAITQNKIALLIPCHRVIKSSGDLSGYRWGRDRKKALIDWERGQGHFNLI